MNLDLLTVIDMYMFINYICTLILGIIWKRIRHKYQGIFLVFADLIVQSIGLTLANFHTDISPIFSIVFANTLIYIGAILLLFGVAEFMDLKVRLLPYIISTGIFISLYSFYTLYNPNKQVRLMVFTLMIIPVFAHTIYLIVVKAEPVYRRCAEHVVIAHIFLILIHGTRAYIGLNRFQVIEYSQLYHSEALLIMSSLLATIYLTFSITQMVHIKLLHQWDQIFNYTQELLKKTQHLADTDNLTQINNRGKIENILKEEINTYMACGRSFCLLMIDIDHFKRFNDTYGHDVGDQVIITVAQRLAQNLRGTDTIGRWGGEEFLVILRDCDNQKARRVGEKLVDIVRDACIDCIYPKEHVTISIGGAVMEASHTMKTLIKTADIALYEAKQNGRNRMEIK